MGAKEEKVSVYKNFRVQGSFLLALLLPILSCELAKQEAVTMASRQWQHGRSPAASLEELS